MPLGRVGKPTIINATLTSSGTEYAVPLPPQTMRIRLQARANDCRFSFRKGQSVDGPYVTIKAGQPAYEVDDVYGVTEVYLASATNGAIVEVLCWT